MDKLQAMQTFVEIVDRGSLTNAARALDRSLPTIVRTLAGLETTLGVQLLRRTTRTMSLTAEGERYAQACRRLLTDVDDLESSLLDDQVQPQGTVRMTAPVLFGTRYVAPAITQLLQDNPLIEVQLTLADQITNLTEDGFDLALRIGALADSTLIAAPLGMMRRVVCAHPRLASLHPVLCPEDLRAVPCVNFQRETDSSTWQFQRSGQLSSVRVHGPLTCNQAQVAAAACADGLGYGQFLEYQVAPMVASGALQVVLRDFEITPVPISLVRASQRSLPPRVRRVLDHLQLKLNSAWSISHTIASF